MTSKADPARLIRYVDRFSRARVLVVGDVMIDQYVWGNVTRISPEAPVPVVSVTKETMLLGGAANVVNNISALGGSVSVCGAIGDDEAGRNLLSLLEATGIRPDGLFVERTRPTTIKTRVIAHNQQVVRFDRETKDSISRRSHQEIFQYVKERMRSGLDVVVLSDYCKGVVTKTLVRDIVTLANRKGILVTVDPKVSHFAMYRGVTILTPNTKEAVIGAKIDIVDDRSLLRAGAAMLRRLKCAAVLITRGEQGMSLFERTGRVTHIPTSAREVYDVTGAGDTVISVLSLAMAAGASLVDSARIANAAAGIVVGVVGTATASIGELKQRIRTSFA